MIVSNFKTIQPNIIFYFETKYVLYFKKVLFIDILASIYLYYIYVCYRHWTMQSDLHSRLQIIQKMNYRTFQLFNILLLYCFNHSVFLNSCKKVWSLENLPPPPLKKKKKRKKKQQVNFVVKLFASESIYIQGKKLQGRAN